ncbi:hypothetical protein Plhal304r1_c082g0167261 [Plasmopara halstedii]
MEAMNGYTDVSRGYLFIAPRSKSQWTAMKFTQTEILSSYSPVVEAKKNNFDQGKAQVLIGCEAIADREGLFTVYSIVTDFMKWDKAVAACYRLYYATIAFWFQDVFKITEKCLLPLIGDGLRDSQVNLFQCCINISIILIILCY